MTVLDNIRWSTATTVDGPVQHVMRAHPCDIGDLHLAVDLLMKTVASAQRPSHVNALAMDRKQVVRAK